MGRWHFILHRGLALIAIFICCGCNASPIEVIAACADSISADITGLEALTASCPQLASALHESQLDQSLQSNWKSTLNREALYEIVGLMDRPTDLDMKSPNVNRLKDVLDQIAKEQPEASHSWWDTFAKWLQSWLSSREIKSVPWLDKLLQKLAAKASLIIVVTYVLATVLTCVVIWFVVKELRITGLIGKKTSISASRSAIYPAIKIQQPLTLGDVENAPLMRIPSLLLQFLVDSLMAHGHLQVHRYLTHRELLSKAHFAKNEDHECFADVSRVAEELMYGGQNIATERVSRIVAAGVELAKRLPSRMSES